MTCFIQTQPSQKFPTYCLLTPRMIDVSVSFIYQTQVYPQGRVLSISQYEFRFGSQLTSSNMS